MGKDKFSMQNVWGLVGWIRDQLIAIDDPHPSDFQSSSLSYSVFSLAQLCLVPEARGWDSQSVCEDGVAWR